MLVRTLALHYGLYANIGKNLSLFSTLERDKITILKVPSVYWKRTTILIVISENNERFEWEFIIPLCLGSINF